MAATQLFTDKFNPKSVSGFVLPDRIKNTLDNTNDKTNIVNYLFYGTSGLGKTSIAKKIAEPFEYLYLNVSENGKIDTLRELLESFCVEIPIASNKDLSMKVIILDELDGGSTQFINALKGFMETYSKNVRFIATTNHIKKIESTDAALLSRFECINFNCISVEEETQLKKKQEKRLIKICEHLNIAITDESAAAIISTTFPDFRKLLQALQKTHRAGISELTLDIIKQKSTEFKFIFDMILDGKLKPEEVHAKLMGDYQTKVKDILESLDDDFQQYIIKNRKDMLAMIPHISIEVCHYQSILNNVIDPTTAMKACIYKLIQIANNMKNRK